MSRVPATERRRELLRQAVELATKRLGDTVICTRCGATAVTMGDICSAPLDEECEGFKAYDAARSQALVDVGFPI